MDQDLRNDSLGAPRDQGRSGWCFAYVAADLLSYELKKKVSASDIAIEYLAAKKGPIVDMARLIQQIPDDGSGTEIGVFKSIRKKGLCLEEKMPSTPDAFREYLLLRGRDFPTDPSTMELLKRCADRSVACHSKSFLFPEQNFCDILQTIVETKKPFSNKNFEVYREASCKERVAVPANVKFVKRWSADGSVTDAIRSAIRRGKPVGIDYKSIISGDGKTDHSSMVVATRSHNGACEYLVRLTQGPTCEGMNKKYECDKKDPGNVWVKEADLTPVLRSITFVP